MRQKSTLLKSRSKSRGSARKRMTIYISEEIQRRLHNAAMALELPKSGIIEAALDERLTALEAIHNAGRPFPDRTGEVRSGRPPLRERSTGSVGLSEAARILGLSKARVYQLKDEEKLKVIIGSDGGYRVSVEELNRFKDLRVETN